MRVLVLGGNRYIGRHLVEALAREGHEVPDGGAAVTTSHVAGFRVSYCLLPIISGPGVLRSGTDDTG